MSIKEFVDSVLDIFIPRSNGIPETTGREFPYGGAGDVIANIGIEMQKKGLFLENIPNPLFTDEKRRQLIFDKLGAALTGTKLNTVSDDVWYEIKDKNGKKVEVRYIKSHAAVRVNALTGEPLVESLNKSETDRPPKAHQASQVIHPSELPTAQVITLTFEDRFDPTIKSEIENIVAKGKGVELTPKALHAIQMQQQTFEPTHVGGQQKQMG